jgi:hypothetical protein
MTRAVFWLALASFLTLGLVTPQVRAQTPNACGCYRDTTGTCKCTKKSKCGCPEDCEPVGCEVKRSKDADREAAAELKRINAREKQRAAAAAKESKQPKAKRDPLPEAGPAPEQQQLHNAVDQMLAAKPAPKKETGKKGRKGKKGEKGEKDEREELVIP